MNIIYQTKIENSICALWRAGKSGTQIEKILNIRFTWKNLATGQTIPIADISRCMQNGLMGWESLEVSVIDKL